MKPYYYREGEIYFSRVYARVRYRQSGVWEQVPSAGAESRAKDSPQFSRLGGGRECFYLLRMNLEERTAARYARRILHPPGDCCVWPVDLLELDPPQYYASRCRLEQPYRTEHKLPEVGPFALLFRGGVFRPEMDGEQWLKSCEELEQPAAERRRFILALLQALQELNAQGYVMNDFHPSRFLLTREGRVVLDYSDWIAPLSGTEDSEGCRRMFASSYPMNFPDPAVVKGSKQCPDETSQNYSLAAFLFYLLFRHHPYDGIMSSGYPEDVLIWREFKFQKMSEIPIFIFDPEDRGNHLVRTTWSARLERRWNDSPQPLREAFIQILRREHALDPEKPRNKTPGEWLSLLRAVEQGP